jgi:predicted DNA binding CopG/RHH family protein
MKKMPIFKISNDLDIPLKVLQQYTKNAISTLNAIKLLKKDEKINIRVSYQTKQALRDKAARLGLRYQTLAGSILHQYANT